MAIYATLGLAGKMAEALRQRNLLNIAFSFGFLLVIFAILGTGLKRRPGHREIWVILGTVTVYGMVMVRSFLTPEERTHLFEYGLVAVLIYQALIERRRNGRMVPSPAVIAVIMTGLLGWLDEGIQWILPNRVYDLRDVGFNALAGLMAITASATLRWVRRKYS